MRGMGYLLLGVGLAWLVWAVQLDTSVGVPNGGAYGLPERVQNLSLAEQKRMHLMLSIGCILVGTLLVGFDHVRQAGDDLDVDDSDYRQCPFCAEEVLVEAKICKHCRSELPALSSSARKSGDRTLSYKELSAAAEAAERNGKKEQRLESKVE